MHRSIPLASKLYFPTGINDCHACIMSTRPNNVENWGRITAAEATLAIERYVSDAARQASGKGGSQASFKKLKIVKKIAR